MEVQNPLFSSQIYPYLHQFLLDQKGYLPQGLKSQEVLAEVFVLCRKAVTDLTPGEKLDSRYIEELLSRTGCSRYAELILCLGWVVLSVQEHPSYSISTFIRELQPLIRHASIFSKARQLAITIRQRERHIQTDFLISPNPLSYMKIEIEGNPGTGNSYTDIHDNHIETLAPNAHTVIHKHYHFSGDTASSKFLDEPSGRAERNVSSDMSDEALEALAGDTANAPLSANTDLSTLNSKLANIDIEPIRQEILVFVSKVRPLLDDAWKADYQKIWEDILNMQEVKEKIYDPGKQKKTNFNQYLVGNILYFMFEDCGACSDDKEYNASEVCMKLIGTTEHQLRKELSKNPPDAIKDRLRDYFTKKFEI